MLSDRTKSTAQTNWKRTKSNVEMLWVGLHAVQRDERRQERNGASDEGVLADLRIAHEIEDDPVAIGFRKNRGAPRHVRNERARVGEVQSPRLDQRGHRRFGIAVELEQDFLEAKTHGELFLVEHHALDVDDGGGTDRGRHHVHIARQPNARRNGIDIEVFDFAGSLGLGAEPPECGERNPEAEPQRASHGAADLFWM